MKTKLSKAEQKTALLYGRIHALTEMEDAEHKAKSFIFNFLKPCYYDPKTFIGRIMAGDGWIVLMAQKKLGN